MNNKTEVIFNDEVETIPTKWYTVVQIESWVGQSLLEENTTGGKAKLIVNHRCGDDKEALISQLNLMIESIKDPSWFGS